jgi:hypothetical protein
MSDLLVGDAAIEQQFFRIVAGQGLATVTDELHRPLLIVEAAVDHAVDVGDQGLEHARGLASVLLVALCVGAPADRPDVDRHKFPQKNVKSWIL